MNLLYSQICAKLLNPYHPKEIPTLRQAILVQQYRHFGAKKRLKTLST